MSATNTWLGPSTILSCSRFFETGSDESHFVVWCEGLPALHKEVVHAQDLEEPVAADADLGAFEPLPDVDGQLARPAARVVDPCRHDKIQH